MKKITLKKPGFHFLQLFISLLSFIIISSCGGGGGGDGGSTSHAPILSNFSSNPSFATQNQGGGQTPVDIYFNFTDQGGDVSSLTLLAYDSTGDQVLAETDSAEGASGLTSGYFSGTLYMDTTVMGTWTFEIYVTDSDGATSNKLTFTFTITTALVSITVMPTNPSIANGTTQQFTATGTFSDNSTQDLTAQVIWSSSDNTKATINKAGLARGTGVGSTTIKAMYESIPGSATLTVTPAVIVSMTVSPTNPIIPKGAVQQFTASGKFSDGTMQDVTATVSWDSSDISVAIISNSTGSNGKASSLMSGTTTITALLGSVSDSTTLNVAQWSKQASGTSNHLTSIVWSGTQFVTVGRSGSVPGSGDILTSPDGATWTKRTTTGDELYGIAYSGSVYAVVGNNGNGGGVILTSSDGAMTWTEQNSGANSAIYSIVWSGSQFVAVGYGIFTSPDGISWTSHKSESTTPILYGVVWSGAQFVAVGTSIITSPDGVTWTTQVADSIYNSSGLSSVTWTGSQFIATGPAGTILISPDGVAWALQTSGVTENLFGIASSLSEAVAVGLNGTTLKTLDGTTWTPLTTGDSATLFGITWSGTQFIAVGSDGTILVYP